MTAAAEADRVFLETFASFLASGDVRKDAPSVTDDAPAPGDAHKDAPSTATDDALKQEHTSILGKRASSDSSELEEGEVQADGEQASSHPESSLTISQLSQEQKQCLARSKSIQDALKSARLQKLICDVESSENRELALDTALSTDPDFHQFVDMLLNEIGCTPNVHDA